MFEADCADVLPRLPDGAFDLIYVDPPWGTGAARRHRRMAVVRDEGGDRTGFGGRRYRSTPGEEEMRYADRFEDYVAFLAPKLERAR
ncbi:MAG TPA: site-specific DNA-methyltransferase, partial [Solirubrobacteraceae bacterium]|nr:site-specific DNA-methyltransferase [Solirubrobacteraceae bacterium]